MSASYFISPNELWNLIGTARRRRSSMCAAAMLMMRSPGVLPTAIVA